MAKVPPKKKTKRRLDWATLHQRTFGTDVLRCPCGGRRTIRAMHSTRSDEFAEAPDGQRASQRCEQQAPLRDVGRLELGQPGGLPQHAQFGQNRQWVFGCAQKGRSG